MNGQSGQALPLAIMALAIGSLVVAPFLGYAGTDLMGSRVYGEAIAAQSAGDAGIEHAIWNLVNGDLTGQLTEPGDAATYQLGETINGLDVDVTVTANATGGTAGEITDTVIDTLEFDTSDGYEPSIINVTGDIYAVAYRGPSNDGFIKTVSINADGDIGNATIDTLEFDTADGYEPCITYVSGNIYAIAYRGTSNDGFLKTVSIAANGNIGNSAIDTLEYDTADGYEPCITHVSGNNYAIAYRSTSFDGFLKTVSISASGDIGNSAIDTLEYDPADGYEPRIINVSGNVYAVTYRGTSNDGFVKTVSIDANGNIGNSAIDVLEYDTANGYEPSITGVSGDVYAIAYRGTSNDGFLKTLLINAQGEIGNATIDTVEFDTADGYEPRIIHVSDEAYAIVYRGPGNRGNLKTIEIGAGGDITSTVIDTVQFDSSSSYEPVMTNISGDIYAIAYRGPGSDGFVKTVEIVAGGAATYEIEAAAGNTTIRAFVSIENGAANITSWQIE